MSSPKSWPRWHQSTGTRRAATRGEDAIALRSGSRKRRTEASSARSSGSADVGPDLSGIYRLLSDR